MSACAKLCSTSAEEEPLSIQCMDDPIGTNAVIIYGEQEFPMPMRLQEEDDHEGNGEEDNFI